MIIFTDIESTGLNPREDHLLEIAMVATDDDLNEIGHICRVVQPFCYDFERDIVSRLHPVVLKMHTENGLLDELRAGKGDRWLVVCKDMMDFCLQMAGKYVTPDSSPPVFAGDVLKKTPLAGSSVGFDRRFIIDHLPGLDEMFSHRSVDASTFTELAKRWAPAVYEGRPKKEGAHRALADARESIEYIKYYRNTFLKV